MEIEKGSSRVISGITSDLGTSACLRESEKRLFTSTESNYYKCRPKNVW